MKCKCGSIKQSGRGQRGAHFQSIRQTLTPEIAWESAAKGGIGEGQEEGDEEGILTKMRKLKTNMRYLMQLRQSPSMVVPLAEASPCPCRITEKKTHTRH